MMIFIEIWKVFLINTLCRKWSEIKGADIVNLHGEKDYRGLVWKGEYLAKAQRSKRQKRHQNNGNHNRFAHTYTSVQRIKAITLGTDTYTVERGGLVLPDSYKKKLRGSVWTFYLLYFLVLLVLKLMGYVTWSWWLVWLPMIIQAILVVTYVFIKAKEELDKGE